MDSVESAQGMTSNRTKAKLGSGGHAFGSWLQIVRQPSVIRMMSAAGLDFAFIDMEHSSLNWETVGDMCEMARACGVTPIVRPYEVNASMTSRVLDGGALGVVLRDVTARSQVDSTLAAMRYPPTGRRGVTAGGAPSDYRSGRGSEVQEFISAQVMLVAQIESSEGAAKLDEILRGGGIDVVEIGRQDLSTSLGVPQEIRHPRVVEVVDAIVAACKRHGVAAGANAASPEDAADLVEMGVRCLSYGSDRSFLASGYRSIAELFGGMVRARER